MYVLPVLLKQKSTPQPQAQNILPHDAMLAAHAAGSETVQTVL
jgi:hypothetical protein